MTDSIRITLDQDVCTGCGRSETHKNVCLICHGSNTLDALRAHVCRLEVQNKLLVFDLTPKEGERTRAELEKENSLLKGNENFCPHFAKGCFDENIKLRKVVGAAQKCVDYLEDRWVQDDLEDALRKALEKEQLGIEIMADGAEGHEAEIQEKINRLRQQIYALQKAARGG